MHITFVNKADAIGSPAPQEFPHRVAVLTWSEYQGSSAAPWDLLRIAIPQMRTQMFADQVIAEYRVGKRVGLLRRKRDVLLRQVSWDDVVPCDDEMGQEKDFPNRILFSQGGNRLMMVMTEFWCDGGGPAPYHDSITLSCFTPEPCSAWLIPMFTDAAKQLGVAVASRSSDA